MGNFVPCNEITRFFCAYGTRLPAFETQLPARRPTLPTPLSQFRKESITANIHTNKQC